MTRRARPEQQVQKAVLGHLAWRAVPGTWWAHYPAGGWRSPIEAAIFKSLGVVAGVPDILIVHRGAKNTFKYLRAHPRSFDS
jgi:hypothetical protein